MQHVLQLAASVAVEHTMEEGGHEEKHRQSGSVDDGGKHLCGCVAAEEQIHPGVHGRKYPESVRDDVGDVFDL